MVAPIEVNCSESLPYKILKAIAAPRSDHEILGFLTLNHLPHCFYILGRPAPISTDVEISESQLLPASFGYPASGCDDFARDKALRSYRRLVIKQDPRTRMKSICFSIISH